MSGATPKVAAKGLRYVDAGTSGRDLGPPGRLLPDGRRRREAVEPLEPIFRSLAPDGRLPATSAARVPGHYVKMVHNGIEYGLMQAYAEGFEIMHASDYDLDLAAIAELWTHGSVVRSLAAGAAGRALARTARTSTHLKGWVADSGEGRWTVQEAIDATSRRRSSRSRC